MLNSWNSWVIKAVQAYTDALGIYPIEQPTERVFRGVKVVKRGTVDNATRQKVVYTSAGDRITPRNIEGAIAVYTVDWNGQQVNVACSVCSDLPPNDIRQVIEEYERNSNLPPILLV